MKNVAIEKEILAVPGKSLLHVWKKVLKIKIINNNNIRELYLKQRKH